MIPKASKPTKKRKSASDSKGTLSNLSCKSCGHVFAAFLKQMDEHNAEQMAKHDAKETTQPHSNIACPQCGKTLDYAAGF